MRLTEGTPPRLRAGLHLDFVTLQLEDVEVASRDVYGDVVDRRRSDRPLEAAGVRVAVEDHVRPVLGDRGSEAIAAEVRPDALRLAVQRVRRRRVVEEDDPDRAVRDLLQTAADRIDLRARLGIDPPQQRFPEVRQLRAREAADETLGADDADFLVRPEDAGRAQTALAQAGMRTENPPEGWLLKAFDDRVLIDLIFDPQGGPVDDGIFERAEELEVHATRLKVAALEDVLVQKLLAISEQEPDYSSVLELARSLREQVDWDEVRERTEDSPFAKGYFTLLDELEIVPS